MSKILFEIQKWVEINYWPLLFWLRLFFYGRPFRRIPLSKQKFASVSPEDYDRLSRFKWSVRPSSETYYAFRYKRVAKSKKYKRLYMHREVLNVPDHLFVDHINHKGLDNIRSNLRPATASQNAFNRQKIMACFTSRFKGVSWIRSDKIWRSQIKVNGKNIHLGRFKSQIQAAKAYDAAARKYHGQFAVLNFPDRPSFFRFLSDRIRFFFSRLNLPALLNVKRFVQRNPESFLIQDDVGSVCVGASISEERLTNWDLSTGTCPPKVDFGCSRWPRYVICCYERGTKTRIIESGKGYRRGRNFPKTAAEG